MKKILLLSMALFIGMAGFSQKAVPVSKDMLKKSAEATALMNTDDATNFNAPVNMMTNADAYSPTETIIGTTWYDLFSNSFIGDRFYRWEDGTMAAVWILGYEASTFPDRGTGYNFFDGSAWGTAPTARIETLKTGWPNIDDWGAGEIGVAHNGVTSLEIIQRDTKGTGAWTQTNFLGPAAIVDELTWPRIITTGENNEYIHLIANSYVEYNSQTTALLYSRSSDGGATWDPQNVILDGTGPDDYIEIGADDYMMAARGNTVCILFGSAWNDLFYLRSDDNGDTWSKNIIWQHPYPFFDWAVTIADTFFCVDNSAHLTLDYDGHVHVVFGINRVAHFETGTTYTLWPLYDGIGYWNDEMETFNSDGDNLNALAPPYYGYADSELEEDVTCIGWMQDVNGNGTLDLNSDILYYRQIGPSTMPSITVDEFGYKYVTYASTTETYEYDVYNYKHIWARGYDVVEGTWGNFIDLTSDIIHIFDESVYPMLSCNTDANIHYIYQADITPGIALDDDHAYQENRWTYGMLPKVELTPSYTGVSENAVIDNSSVSQNFPNPFSGVSTVNVTLQEAANLSLVVTNMTGQKVMELNKGFVPAQNHTFTIDASNLQSGIYFYTVTAGQSQVTRKMIVE